MNPKPLWNKAADNSRPLRKPRCMVDNVSNENFPIQPNEVNTTSNEIISGNSAPQNLNFVTRTFDNMHIQKTESKPTLNPDAPEWFPSYISVPYNNVEPPSSVQDRLKLHKSQPEPQNSHKDNEDLGISSDNFVYNNDFEHDADFPSDERRLRQIINSLSKDPGQFDNMLDLFMETLMPYLEDFMALSVIVQLLVEQAIDDSNFRYSGAKLCWYVEQNCPEFRAELHLQCKKQLEVNKSLQDVVLFIAELYTQLPHLNVYGTLLIESFKKLLVPGNNENIKCICRALKLTGYSLEQSNKVDLDDIMKQLENNTKHVNGSILSLLNSIVNLRQNNWGHTNDTTSESEESEVFYDNTIGTSIRYQTDGDNLTNEENEFIAAHFQHGHEEFFSDMSDPDELCDPEPEMDEEIQAAFKEFLKYSSQK